MKKKNKQHKYGLLSMMAMIIGIVIGSGIFVKNSTFISSNGSILNTMLAWIIGSIIVVSILIAFLEIFSITTITNEQSTITNWGKRLLGVRFGKVIGYYATFFYIPVLIAAFLNFAASQFIDTMAISGVESFANIQDQGGFELFGLILAIAAFLLIVLAIMNSFSKLPGKYLQNIGTAVKTIPLFFIVFLFLFLLMTNIDQIDFNQEIGTDIFDPSTTSKGSFSLIFLTLPAVLFSFDGFLLAGALSKEAKSKNSFKIAVITSIIFIIIIYFLFSIAIFGLGDASTNVNGDYGTITNTIYATIGEDNLRAANIISPILSLIISLSILTGASGLYIISTRSIYDLSKNNALYDSTGEIVTKNKGGVPTYSGALTLIISLAWFLFMSTFDALIIQYGGSGPLVITGFMTDLIIVGIYSIYSLLIIGAIINRFTNKTKVEKNILFFPAAFIALLGVSIILIIFTINILLPPDAWSAMKDADKTIYLGKIIATTIFLSLFIIVSIFNLIRTNNIKEEVIELKEEIIEKTEVMENA